MADVTQVDSADIQVPIETGVVSTTPFPYYSGLSGYGGTVGNFIGAIYDGYLYVTATLEDDPTTNYVAGGNGIYRIALDNLGGSWEKVGPGAAYTTSNNHRVCTSRACFSVDGRYLYWMMPIFYNAGPSIDATRRGWTTVLDLSNPNSWDDDAVPNNSDVLSYNFSGNSTGIGSDRLGISFAIASSTHIHLIGGSESSYRYNCHSRIAISGLSGNSWSNGAYPPVSATECASVFDPVNNCIYVLGGVKGSDYKVFGNSTEILKYDVSANTWTRNALPALPMMTFWNRPAIAHRKLYVIGNNSSSKLTAYIDLDNTSAGWTQFTNPGGPSYAISVWDQTRNRILAIAPAAPSGTGTGIYVLNLKADQTPDGAWTHLCTGGVGQVQSELFPSIDVPFEITSETHDRQQSGVADVPFTIESFGYRISSHTATYINPVTITIQSAGTGASGIAGVGTTDCVFPILSEAVETPPPSEIAFTIQSAATGSALVQESQTGTVDIPVVVTTYGQAATGVIGTASILAIDKWYFGGAIAATNIIGMGECDVTVDVGMLYESQNGAIGATGSGAATVLFSLARAFGSMSESHGGAVIVPPATVDGWTVNLATGGHTQFTNWQFNSLFELNGQRYACNDTGLFRLTGNRDGDAVIDGCVISGVTDFGTMKLKYINSAYVHLRTDGDVAFRMVADEQRNRSGYHISFDGRQGIHRRRRKLAKGIKGTVWQAEMRNVDGADMEVAKVELLLAKSKRAIG